MNSAELRKVFLEFFREREHKITPSSSLLPDDPSVLLTTAGMQQFKKYYTGEADSIKDFGSKNTASIQKSFRTSDIDEVGDESHLTFFEMLGNFSFGGYWKKEAIKLASEFLISNFQFPISKLNVTVFGGDKDISADTESEQIWRELGVSKIEKRGREDNFWGPTGNKGPCGPTTEIYINGVEIWNIVFNEFYRDADGKYTKLGAPGIDTGMGLERLAMVSQGKKNIFETDLFAPYIELLPSELDDRVKRIVVDHLRASIFLISDGVKPSNKEAGYVLRRLLRKLFMYEKKLPKHMFDSLLHDIIHEYGNAYPELIKNSKVIRDEFSEERGKYIRTMEKAYDEFTRRLHANGALTTTDVFDLKQSFGLNKEQSLETISDMIKAMASNADLLKFDENEFNELIKKHQEVSRAGIEKKFGGHGLILDTGELKAADEDELKKVTRLHTATHLMQAALRRVLGESVRQAGSDITAERTRFDFTFERKLTNEELVKIEALVNDAVQKSLPTQFVELPIEEAKKSGALFFFKEKYPATVKVYYVGNSLEEAWSKEFCGGPHVKNTSEIGQFKILKQEPVGSGLRRIRATVLP